MMKHFTCVLVLCIIVHISESLKFKQHNQRKASSRKYSLTALEQFISALSSSDGEFKAIFAPVLVKLHNLKSQAGKSNIHLNGKTQSPRKKSSSTSETLIRGVEKKKSSMSEDKGERNISKDFTASKHHSQRYREGTSLTTEIVQFQNISNQTGLHSFGQSPLNITPSLGTNMKMKTFVIQGSIHLSGSGKLMHSESVSSVMGFNRSDLTKTSISNSIFSGNATLQRKFNATLLLSKYDPLKSEEQMLKLTGYKELFSEPGKSVINGNSSQQRIVTVRPSASSPNSFIGIARIAISGTSDSHTFDINHNTLKVTEIVKYPIKTTMMAYRPTSTPSPQKNFHGNTKPNPSLSTSLRGLRTTVPNSRKTDKMTYSTETLSNGEDYHVAFAPELDHHHLVIPMTEDKDQLLRNNSFRVMRTLLLLLGAFVGISFTLCILYLWFRTCSFYKLYVNFLKKGYQKVEKVEKM